MLLGGYGGYGLSVLSRPAPSILAHGHEAPQRGHPAGALCILLPRRRLARWPLSINIRPDPIRKPLLYPSELRGHGRATQLRPLDLREAALALSQPPRFGLATVLSQRPSVPVSALAARSISVIKLSDHMPSQEPPRHLRDAAKAAGVRTDDLVAIRSASGSADPGGAIPASEDSRAAWLRGTRASRCGSLIEVQRETC
jgi:hypothetical protein